MGTTIVNIVIDWGFSRFKLYALNSTHCLILEESYLIVDIVSNPAFYDPNSLETIKNLIVDFTSKFLDSAAIHFFISSQMHALVGICTNEFKFISTWNDLPIDAIEDSFIEVHEGVPLLHSMPFYKIKSSEDKFVASTRSLADFSPSESYEISRLGSPLALLLAEICEVPIPCSRSWWQSTCLSSKFLGTRLSGFTFLAESPLVLPKFSPKKFFNDSSEIVIYPELGDLQASSSKSVKNHTITINLGTGSQIIFRDIQPCYKWPFYRFWPYYDNPLVTISHIPCGRLLSSYCDVNNLSLRSLSDVLESLIYIDIVSVAQSNLTSLLYFPGYCSVESRYIQKPTVSLQQIAKISPSVVLCLWIYQYISLINKATPSIHSTNKKVSVGVAGDLGGMSYSFCQILNKTLDSNISTESIDSLFDFSQLSAA